MHGENGAFADEIHSSTLLFLSSTTLMGCCCFVFLSSDVLRKGKSRLLLLSRVLLLIRGKSVRLKIDDPRCRCPLDLLLLPLDLVFVVDMVMLCEGFGVMR